METYEWVYFILSLASVVMTVLFILMRDIKEIVEKVDKAKKDGIITTWELKDILTTTGILIKRLARGFTGIEEKIAEKPLTHSQRNH